MRTYKQRFSDDRWPPSLRVSLEALVYGIAPIDPVTFIAAPSLLVIAALAACIAPAVRALRVDPASQCGRSS